jgi:catechol 2,3-dioxygenase-like lactoylglutathione lyase family enzyme
MRLNQVTLPAINMKQSCRFYRKMGFVQIVDTEHYARFICPEGGSTFSLSLVSELLSNPTTIYFEDENLDTVVANLIIKGFVFDQMPTDMSYLWREAILKDPSNNKIKLYWAGTNRLNPPWRVNLTE